MKYVKLYILIFTLTSFMLTFIFSLTLNQKLLKNTQNKAIKWKITFTMRWHIQFVCTCVFNFLIWQAEKKPWKKLFNKNIERMHWTIPIRLFVRLLMKNRKSAFTDAYIDGHFLKKIYIDSSQLNRFNCRSSNSHSLWNSKIVSKFFCEKQSFKHGVRNLP